MSRTVSRTIDWKSMYVCVVISPRTRTSPVVVAVSQATRASGSSRMIASRIASETWSHILSGWPSVTDSEVKRYCEASTMLMGAKGSMGIPSTRPGRRYGARRYGRRSGPRPNGLEVELELDAPQRLVVDHAVVAELDDRLALGEQHRDPDRAMVELLLLGLIDCHVLAWCHMLHLMLEGVLELVDQRRVVGIVSAQLLEPGQRSLRRDEPRVGLLGLDAIPA